jgi:hypothetical protein
VEFVIKSGLGTVQSTLSGAFGSGVYPNGISDGTWNTFLSDDLCLSPTAFSVVGWFSDALSDGSPLNTTYSVFPVEARRGLRFTFDTEEDVKDVRTSKFVFDTSQLEATAENQLKGQGMPYKGVLATFFYYFAPVFVHLPNFAHGDRYLLISGMHCSCLLLNTYEVLSNCNSFIHFVETCRYLLTQDNNTDLETTSGSGGIEIYRLVEDYSSATLMDSPSLITSDDLDTYEAEGVFVPFINLEPARCAVTVTDSVCIRCVVAGTS